MDIFDVGRTCRRRWRVFVPLLVVTMMLAGIAYTTVPTVFQAESTVGLAPSPVTGSEGNGILNNGGTLMLANLTATGLSSPTVVDEVIASTGATGFTAEVVTVPGGQMPLVTLITTAHDLGTAARALDVAHIRAQEVLDRIQSDAGVSERSYGIVYQVSYGPILNELRPGRKRLLAGVVGLGLVASVLAALSWDLLARRRDELVEVEEGLDEDGGRPLDLDDAESIPNLAFADSSPDHAGTEANADLPPTEQRAGSRASADERPDTFSTRNDTIDRTE